MHFVDYYPNAERAITLIDMRQIGLREYQFIITLSKSIKEEIEQEIKIQIQNNDITRYYFEEIIKNLQIENLTPLKREILIGNAILPDSKKIIDIQNKNGYSVTNLTKILRFRTILKNILLNDLHIDKNTQEQFEIYKKELISLTEIFKNEFNLDNPSIILNRICELITIYPQLFQAKTTINSKKR